MKSAFFHHIIVAQGTPVLQLLSSEDQALLFRWNTFLILNLGFDIINCVRWLDIEGDCFTCFIYY